MAGYRLISTQPQSDEQELLERLKGVPKTKLVTTAREADGLDESSQNGATVKPRYQPREIDCYAITESEMKQLGLSNLLTSAFFGIGSALIAFAIDLTNPSVVAKAIDEDQKAKLNLGSGTPATIINEPARYTAKMQEANDAGYSFAKTLAKLEPAFVNPYGAKV